MLSEFDKFLRWWAEGLSLIVPKRWRDRRQQLKQYLLLYLTEHELVIEHHHGGTGKALERRSLSLSEGANQNLARDWLAKSPQLLALPTILRLAPESVLVKRLRYPTAVRDDLKNVIAFDIDRQTPFAREDVYFDIDDVTNDNNAKHLQVDLIVVPKKDLEPLNSILSAVGLRLSVIDVANRTFVESRVNLLPNQEIWRNNSPRYRLRFALFFLWMTLIALIPGKQILETEATIKLLERQERSGIAGVKSLNELRQEHARLTAKLSFFDQSEARHIATTGILLEVTRLLSDDTWVRRFDFKNDTLTLQGESTKASEIPAVLEGSPIFSAPKFSSPVTRNNATGNDRFQIVVSVEPGGRS